MKRFFSTFFRGVFQAPIAPLVLGLLLLLISIRLNYREFDSVILSTAEFATIVKELGFAFVIACVIICFIEFDAKKEYARAIDEHTKEVTGSVLLAAYGTSIPTDIFDFYKEKLLSEARLRTSLSYEVLIRYTREVIEDYSGGDEVCLEVKVVSTVKNIGNNPIDYKAKLFVDNPIDENLTNEAVCRFARVGDKVYKSPAPSEHARSLVVGDAKLYVFDSVPMATGADLNTRFEYRLFKRLSDNEELTLLIPTKNIDVSVSSPRELDVVARFGGAVEPVVDEVSDTHYCFKVDGVAFPGNSILLSWRPK